MINSVELCYYCGINKSENKYVFKKTIYSKLDSEYGLGLLGIKKTTRYYEKEFEISRCTSCFKEHSASNKPAGVVALITLIFSGTITYVFAKRVYVALIVGIIVSILAMAVFIQLTYRKRLKLLGIKDANEIEDFAPIKDLLNHGWQTLKP